MLGTCYYCNLPGADSKIPSYWSGNKVQRNVHKACASSATSYDAYQCQLIDADCNDCAFFKQITNYGKGCRLGTCTKFNRQIMAYANFARGMRCFVHRKDKTL